jgi:hypothetical protein
LPRRHQIIRVLTAHAAQTPARWKSRKAGERALRYVRVPSMFDSLEVKVLFTT